MRKLKGRYPQYLNPTHILSFLDLLNASFMERLNKAMLLGDLLFS